MNVVLPLCSLLCAVAPPPGEAPSLTLTAERVLHDGASGLTTAEGDARFTAPGAAIDADRVTWSQSDGVVTAVGHVVARLTQGGLFAVTADVVTLRLEAGEVSELYLLDGRAVAKSGVSAGALLEAHTAGAVASLGRTTALLEGNHLVRDGQRWRAERLSLVPCDCNADKPSWSITASSAVIDDEAKRVSVVSPVVRVKQVPVLWLPWLSLPMTDRQTGLLFPRVGYSQLNGFGVEAPVFITLGRSADVTVTPGYFSGGQGTYGLAGPRLSSELRYVPSRRARGRLTLGVLYDLRSDRDPVRPALTGPGRRGLRGEASWEHVQDLDAGFGLRVDARAYSDGYYNRDLVPDVVASTSGYLRSTALVTQRGEDHLLSLDVTLRQDLAWGYDIAGRGATVPGSTAPPWGPNTLQRLPAFTVTLPTRSLVGPLAFDLRADAVRLAPLRGVTGDEGAAAREGRLTDDAGNELPFACLRERLYAPDLTASACGVDLADKLGQGDGRFEPGEREARDRLTLLPRVSAAVTPGGALSLSAFAGWRQSVWRGEATGRSWSRGYPLLGARAETGLTRAFGGLRHTLTPAVEVRAVPTVLRTSSSAEREPVAFDDVDASLPEGAGAVLQGVAELRQRLVSKRFSLALDLGQGVDLRAAALAESYGRVALDVGWFSALTAVRFDAVTPRLTRLSGRLALDDGAGHGGWVTAERLLDDGTQLARTPIDLLFGAPLPPGDLSHSTLVSGGVRWAFGPVGLRYEVLLLDKLEGLTQALGLAQHTLGVTWAPACDCWRLEVSATQRPTGRGGLGWPDLGLGLTVNRFGSIGVGR